MRAIGAVLIFATCLGLLGWRSLPFTQQSPQPATAISLAAKLETQPAGSSGTAFSENRKAIAELLSAIAWPLVFVTLLITQKSTLTRIFEGIVGIVQSSTRIKLGEIVDIEVDRSAKQAEEQTSPPQDVPLEQVEAASRVSGLASSAELLPTIRTRLLDFAKEYETTRSNLGSGPRRTAAMNAIVAKMRTLALAAKPLLPEFSANRFHPAFV
jgi:hypothetical protein